ncbi:MAG TPA: type II toxin-antitoxin system RelE/ParE family toxin [Usitatibacteraceae bacterium]|nr:type II toxin-antitoxin system RelE/ParE family toxin [Usitatibacteraceae bacterium]
MKRVLVTRAFDRWCTLGSAVLCRAAREVEAGRFEADLGRGLVKKRVAYPGRGKSGGARLLVAWGNSACLVFIVGRDKSDPGADFSAAQVESAKELAVAFARLDSHQLGVALLRGAVKEIHCGEEVSSAR